ncbi:hypothetical protein ACA910_001801 [Epithemia clementina (nom. ined.)]
MAKKAWERWAADYRVTIKHYHADNGRFADNGFIQHCAMNKQSISYCGVNAHFQNGITEKRIRDLQEATRTALLYALHKWPRMITVHLWPYAMQTANDVHNSTPMTKTQRSPLELFSGVKVSPKLRHFHPFGCPTYVLDNALQAQKGISKWKTRARMGVYLGPSPNHSRSVHLVLNPRTAHVSPQFHVRHDDFFETVQVRATDFDSPKPEWRYLSGLAELKEKVGRTDENREGTHIVRPVLQMAQLPPTVIHQPSSLNLLPPLNTDDQTGTPGESIVADTTLEPAAASEAPINLTGTVPTVVGRQTRSGRVVKDTQRYSEGLAQREQGLVAWETMIDQDGSEDVPTAQAQYDLQALMDEPVSFAATTDPDTMYYHEAMREPDRELFRETMQKEIQDHKSRNHWEIVLLKSIPFGTRIIDMIWSMKRKRRINTREVYKRKACLNVHGGQQEFGLNYWETYSPVVNWQTLRLFFILSILRGWHNRQMDFVLAYPHAPAEVPLYTNFPQGYVFPPSVSRTTHALKLKQNLYGQKQAGRIWNKYLDAGLAEIGFAPSKIDPCLYYRGQVILLVYIDDCVLFSPKKTDLAAVIKEMQDSSRKFRVEDLGEVNDFLGVKIRRRKNGDIELSQPHLIDAILRDLHFQENTAERTTPALSTVLLHKDAEGKVWDQDFHYRRVIGKLNFLEKSTRPDIAYAVHQCARFCADPKKSHADAVRRIGKYLKGTRSKGIVLRPDKTKSFECWVDADFCSGFRPGENNAKDPMSSKSRSGWVLTYAGCPITWASKMQTLTALSSTESEYIALSSALRDMIPLMELAKEIQQRGVVDKIGQVPAVHCAVWEDNSGALEMAKVHKVRPRTKHLNNQYHHFRGYVDRREIELFAKATDEQIADMLTKPLPEGPLCKHRMSLQGW